MSRRAVQVWAWAPWCRCSWVFPERWVGTSTENRHDKRLSLRTAVIWLGLRKGGREQRWKPWLKNKKKKKKTQKRAPSRETSKYWAYCWLDSGGDVKHLTVKTEWQWNKKPGWGMTDIGPDLTEPLPAKSLSLFILMFFFNIPSPFWYFFWLSGTAWSTSFLDHTDQPGSLPPSGRFCFNQAGFDVSGRS